MKEESNYGRYIIGVIVVVFIIAIIIMFASMGDITLVDPNSLQNVTLQVTLQ